VLCGHTAEKFRYLRLENVMFAPAFMGSFDDPADESSSDADAITHRANRPMDYHDRFLRGINGALPRVARAVSARAGARQVVTDELSSYPMTRHTGGLVQPMGKAQLRCTSIPGDLCGYWLHQASARGNCGRRETR
jgi:hypothetical protein